MLTQNLRCGCSNNRVGLVIGLNPILVGIKQFLVESPPVYGVKFTRILRVISVKILRKTFRRISFVKTRKNLLIIFTRKSFKGSALGRLTPTMLNSAPVFGFSH